MAMTRLLVNDCLTTIPGTRTFWSDLQDWFGMEFVGGDYSTLAEAATSHTSIVDDPDAIKASLIVRNATWFPPIKTDIPTISLLQDIITEGAQREMQEAVIKSSSAVVFNSKFTYSKYDPITVGINPGQLAPVARVIPLPVDFDLFQPGNAMGLQQALSLPDNCVLWVGASQGPAGHVKGYDIFMKMVRLNPDISFVGVFKDVAPEYHPPNLRTFTRLSHADLVKVMGACKVGVCTSRTESQHLAGIEMGACGLPVVAPEVGCYFGRTDMPGVLIREPAPETFAAGCRAMLMDPGDPQKTREYWRKEFDKSVIKVAWTKLIEEVEHNAS